MWNPDKLHFIRTAVSLVISQQPIGVFPVSDSRVKWGLFTEFRILQTAANFTIPDCKKDFNDHVITFNIALCGD